MIYRNEDITTVTNGIVIHGVNCQGVMGSGVAKAIKTKWPIMYEVFQKNGAGKKWLGSSHIITISDEEDKELYVANCYTQEHYGPGDRAYASTEAISNALNGVFSFASTIGLTIHSPMIGCGLGGLEWDKVGKIYQFMIQKHDYDNVIIYYI